MAFKGYALKARGIFAYAKMPNVLIAAYVHPGRRPGLGAQLGFQPAPMICPAAHSTGVFNKIGCGSAISSKLDCTRLALSLYKIGIGAVKMIAH